MLELYSLAAALQTKIIDRVKDPWQTIETSRIIEKRQDEKSEIRIGLKFNNFRLINQVLRDCNHQLPFGGLLFGFFETLAIR